MTLDKGSPSSIEADGAGSVPDLAGLPMGAAYRLDAEFFEAEDLDGVGEGALGSGNLNHLILQSQLINGLGDPTGSGADALADTVPLAADLAARGAGFEPAATVEPTFEGRPLEPAHEDAPAVDGATSDQRGFGQPAGLVTLIGGSQTAGAGAGGFTARFAGGGGAAADVSVADVAPPAVEPNATPTGPPPGDVPADPGVGLADTAAGTLDDVLHGIDDLSATVADVVAPVVEPVVEVIGQALDALPGGVGDTVGDLTATGGELAQAALDGADQVVDALSAAGDDLIAAVGVAATDAMLATALETVTDAIPMPAVADRLAGTFQDMGASLVADAGETITALQGSAAPAIETVNGALNGFAGSAAETSAAVSSSLQETVAPVVDGAQQAAAPLLDAVQGAADDAAGQVTGALDDGAAAVADAATPFLDDAADLGASAGDVVDGATDATTSLLDDAANAADDAAAPILDDAQAALDDAAGQVTGAVDDGAATVADATAPVLDQAADLGATVGDAVDGVTDDGLSLLDDATQAGGDGGAPLLDEAGDLGQTVGDAVDGATDDTASLLDDAGQVADTAGSDLGGLTDSLLADDTGSSGDQDLSITAEGGVDGNQQAGTASEVNLDPVENLTGDIDIAVDGSADAPAEIGGSVDATIDDLSAAADTQDLDGSLETVDGQPLDDALGDIQSDLAAMDGATSNQGDLVAAAGDDSALDGSIPDDLIGDLAPDTSALGTDSFDDVTSGGGETLPEPDGVAAEGLGMLLDPQIDQSPGAGLFG